MRGQFGVIEYTVACHVAQFLSNGCGSGP